MSTFVAKKTFQVHNKFWCHGKSQKFPVFPYLTYLAQRWWWVKNFGNIFLRGQGDEKRRGFENLLNPLTLTQHYTLFLQEPVNLDRGSLFLNFAESSGCILNFVLELILIDIENATLKLNVLNFSLCREF